MVYGVSGICCFVAFLAFIGCAIRREWRRAWVAAAVVVISLGVFNFNTPASQPYDSPDVADAAPEPAATQTPGDSQNPMIGETATIRRGAGMGCPGTRDGLHQLIDALVAKDDAGISDAIYNSGGFQLANGDRVRVIQQEGFAGLEERIRMLSGEHAGEACWIEADTHIF